ncbi:STAS domain-containing protein [Streptomyces sp. NPDC058000]|uniref:STAS domain-containing protein n=1 Tax=Streptomyces sp. NPDC058000 TaxID=3346299 RepID=UPI0036E0D209
MSPWTLPERPTSNGTIPESPHDRRTAHAGRRALHVDCGGLVLCDSMGLSALLMVHRRTSTLGVRLHLEERPPALDRPLTVTGTPEHLTAPPAPPRLPRH